MSTAFPYYLRNTIYLFNNNPKNPKFSFYLGSLFLIGHGVYAYGSTNLKKIEIKEKYQFTANGFTNFMVIDTEDTHYRVNNSFWFLKYNSIEDWCKMNKKTKLFVKIYGFRIPFFGIFPNIIQADINKISEQNNNIIWQPIDDYPILLDKVIK